MLLIDTDIAVDLLREVPEAVAWLESLEDERVGMPGFVLLEALEGETNKEGMNRTLKTLRRFVVYWPSALDCGRAVTVLAEAKLSHGLDAFDALIGETAVGLGVPLCTFNVKHFIAIPDLVTIQPYVRPKR